MQGGSILSFMIVGFILTLIFVGGVYLLNKRGDQVRKDQAIATADNQNTDTSVIESGDSSDGIVDDDSNMPSDLPETGADLHISELIGAFVLPMMIVQYLSSRRSLVRYL
jgi:hypothetical protein